MSDGPDENETSHESDCDGGCGGTGWRNGQAEDGDCKACGGTGRKS